MDQYFEDYKWEELGGLLELAKLNQGNNRLATLKAIEEVQRDERESGEDLLRSVGGLGDEEYSFVPEGGFDHTNVKNNAERFRDNKVIQENNMMDERGNDLLRLTEDIENWMQGPEYFVQNVNSVASDFSAYVAESMGHPDQEAVNSIDNYLEDALEVDPNGENPLSDRDYTHEVARIFRSLQGDRLKAFMAMTENPNTSYSEIEDRLGLSSGSVSKWVNSRYGWKEEGLHKQQDETTQLGNKIYNLMLEFYDEVN